MFFSYFFHYLFYGMLIITSLYGAFLYPMKQEQHSLLKDNFTGFGLVLKHGSIFNHDMVCALALVNKFCNAHIQSTAHFRKQYFSEGSNYHKNKLSIIWHRNGSAYAYAYFFSDNRTRYLCMKSHYLLDEKSFRSYTANWNNKAFSLLGAPNIFFTQKGEVCFYATGIINVLGHGVQREVIEYTLDAKGNNKKTRCVIGTKDSNGQFVSVSLAQLAKYSFPSLTRAVLNSSHVSELSTPWHKDTVKVFHWDGVDIPRHYHNHKELSDITFNALRGKTCPNAHAAKN